MRSIGIIPSRYASTRFPGKPLVDIQGKSMIQRVYEQVSKSRILSNVIVATDDDRIYDHVVSFGGKVLMTSVDHVVGTTRCNEVISQLEKEQDYYDVAINIQGDEPTINHIQIDDVLTRLLDDNAQIATLAKQISSTSDLFDPNVVKVVLSTQNRALYFSRQAIPFQRGIEQQYWLENTNYFKHIGLYGYKTEILKKISCMPTSELEGAESLEQLRWLENGVNIFVDITDFESIAIDTPDDLLKLETIS